MGSGNTNAQISDNSFRTDLINIHNEVDRPIILLFDEGNVLANSRVHLEKLRNIFMNTPGYMLVLIGTPDLFPVMDDVFSPIVRQFKKINVGSFTNKADTEACIRRPLEKISLKPEDIFDFETYRDVSEIHDLSGGRPYEIQLICHKLFQRVQSKRARRMKLDLAVLEDVRKELETSQDVASRPLLLKIRNLKKNQLRTLSLLCACDSQATFDQIWSLEYIFNDENSLTKSKLEEELKNFVAEGIIRIEGNQVNFNGDDFDKIYTKYFAREQKITINFLDIPFELFSIIKSESMFQDRDMFKPISRYIGSDTEMDIGNYIQKLLQDEPGLDVFVESPPIIEDVYDLLLDHQNKETIPVIHVKLALPWLKIQFWYSIEKPDDEKLKRILENDITKAMNRCSSIGGELVVQLKNLPTVPMNIQSAKLKNTANEKIRNTIASNHVTKMVKVYLEKSNIQEVLFHATLSYEYNPEPPYPDNNNIGYLFMINGELIIAKQLLNLALKSKKESFEDALPLYNLAVLEAKNENFELSTKYTINCIEKIKDTLKKKRVVACVLSPELLKGRLEFKEIKEPDLLEIALKLKQSLEKIMYP